MKKITVGIILSILFITTGYSICKADTLEDINKLDTVLIKRKFFTIGKGYDIYDSNRNRIGEIEGKFFVAGGDKLTFTDNDGKEIAIADGEKQLFNMDKEYKISVKRKDIGCSLRRNTLSMSNKVDFFEKDKGKKAYSKNKVMQLFKNSKIMNSNKGNTAYKINQKFSIFNRKYKVDKKDDSEVSMLEAIFYTCLNDNKLKSNGKQ